MSISNFDRAAQQRRVSEFEAAQLQAGAKPPAKTVVRPAPIMPSVLSTPAIAIPPKAKASKVTYAEVPFTNDLGQVVNPGALIIAVTSAYGHQINVRPGVYLGATGKAGKVSSVSVRVLDNKKQVNRTLPGKRVYLTI